MMQAVSESSGRATVAQPVEWIEMATGMYSGRIAGRQARATVVNHGYAVSASLGIDGPLLNSQEFRTFSAAVAAAGQWLQLLV